MSKRIKVQVKQKHITKGIAGDGDSCPIAYALKDMGYKGLHVEGDQIIGSADYAPLPLKAQRFIRKFDDGEKVKPFNFTITWKSE